MTTEQPSTPDQPLTLVHTVPALAETFSEMLQELAPEIPVRHVMKDEYLQAALAAGVLTDEVRQGVEQALLAEAERGGVVLCTCSTVGPGADDAARHSSTPVLRIDRPMAAEAIRAGRQIVVCATVQTTIGPTVSLLEETARELGRGVELRSVVFADALALLQAGDQDGYARAIAQGLREAAASAEVIVLAQASMAPALQYCADITVPILTSPRSGLEAAIERYRALA